MKKVIVCLYGMHIDILRLNLNYWKSTYVVDSNNGYSSHSRWNTIHLSIVKLDGSKVEMPSDFYYFLKLADRDYNDVSETAKTNAILLEEIMKECGFNGYSEEWWHYSYKTNYPVVD